MQPVSTGLGEDRGGLPPRESSGIKGSTHRSHRILSSPATGSDFSHDRKIPRKAGFNRRLLCSPAVYRRERKAVTPRALYAKRRIRICSPFTLHPSPFTLLTTPPILSAVPQPARPNHGLPAGLPGWDAECCRYAVTYHRTRHAAAWRQNRRCRWQNGAPAR